MIDSKQVWAAFEAYNNEVRSWRFVERGSRIFAVRDLINVTHLASTTLCDEAYQEFQADNREQAEQYIQWKGIENALKTYAAMVSPVSP